MSPQCDDLQFATLLEEFTDRLRSGHAPTVAEYVSDHPDLAERIERIFPSIIALEQMNVHQAPASTVNSPFKPGTVMRLGDYRILKEIGRGGMGIVYEAEQESLKRKVAIKVLTPHALVDQRQIQRFRNEAETASRLRHDHIVPIHAIGECDGVHYFSMQLIEGEGLDDLIAKWKQEGVPSDHVSVVAEWIRQAAQALQHAHSSLVLHRDIKPSNLLVGSDGKLWITDFGIARALDEAGITRTGDFIGTLQYAPPEQVNGVSEARSDVYSLGLTLYEALALKPAFDLSTKRVLGGAHHRQGIKPLTRVNPRIPRDLETIVIRCTEEDVSQRYASAAALADDLARFIRGEPILARTVSRFQRLRTWCRRNRLEAAAAALTLMAITIAGTVGWVAYAKADNALTKQRAAEQLAQSNYLAQVAATQRAEGSLKLAQDVLTEFYDVIIARDQELQMPGGAFADVPVSPSISERELELLRNLLAYYDRSSKLSAGQSDLVAERARTLSRVGDIHRWTGAFSEAIDAYAACLKILGDLHQKTPTQKLVMKMAVLERHVALTYSHLGEWSKAFKHVTQSSKWLRGSGDSTQPMKVSFEFARTLNVQGALYASASEKVTSQRGESSAYRQRMSVTPAVRSHREALEVARALKEVEPHNPEVQFLIAATARALAEVLIRAGQRTQAIVLLVEASELLDGLASDFAEVPDYRLEQGLTLAVLGSVQAPENQGLVLSDKAIDIVRELLIDFPDVPRFQESLAWVLHRSGDSKRRARLFEEAQAELAESAEIREELVERFPTARHHRWGLVMTLRSIGRLQWLSGDTTAAIATHQETVRRFDQPQFRSQGASRVPLGPVLRDLSGLLEQDGQEWEADHMRSRARMWANPLSGGRRF